MRLLGLVVGALVWPLLAWATIATAADADRPRHVLLLYAESRFLPAVIEVDAAFRSTVASSPGAPVIFHTEFLDLPPMPSSAHEHRLRDLLRVKYQDVHLDLIMACAPTALRTALDYRAELGPRVPIVFTAVDSVRDFRLPSDVTGVLMTFDWMDTLGAALRLQPEARRVVVVAGSSALDKRWVAAARAAFADAPPHLEFTYVTELPLEAAAERLAGLPDGTIVFLVSFLRDIDGRNPSSEEFLERPVADRPSCLVLDVWMPGSSGMDLQAALQAARREIPIVFITGQGDVSTGVRAMKDGAVDFLEKPFRAPELLACVQRALARSRQSRGERAERAAVERRFATLTLRERDVLRLVVTGMLNKQIAAKLGIAEKTVKIHRSHMTHKMEADSVAELVAMAHKLEPPGSGR